MIGLSCSGISETLYNSIGKCDDDIREEMYKNVVLSGGSTMFKGWLGRVML